MQLVRDSLKMASIDNLRAKQYKVAAFTNNKMGLRARVLENCGGPQYSKEILKNSSLASPLLFGEGPNPLLKGWNPSLHLGILI